MPIRVTKTTKTDRRICALIAAWVGFRILPPKITSDPDQRGSGSVVIIGGSVGFVLVRKVHGVRYPQAFPLEDRLLRYRAMLSTNDF